MNRRFVLAVLIGFLLLPAVGRAEEDTPSAPSIAVLVDRVRNGTNEQFVEALAALSAMGAEAAEAVPHLIDNLNPPDEGRRAQLSSALVAIGEPAVPALTRGLMSWSGHVSIWCVRTLGQMEGIATSAVPNLVESLDGAHPEFQVVLLKALGGIGAPASSALPAVRMLLRSKSGDVRVEAVRTLGLLGAEATALLVDLAASDDPVVAAEARKALGRAVDEAIQPSAETLKNLAAHLRKGSETLRIEAARAIGVLGPRAIALLPALEEALGDSSVRVRRATIAALAALGPAAAQVVDRLMVLFAKDPDVRASILQALPFFGAKAERTIPEVARWLSDGDLRRPAAFALARFGEAAIPQLAAATQSASFRVRGAAVWALAEMKRSAELRLPAFVTALGDEASSIRYAACDALGALGNQAAPALSALRERLADEVEGVRVAAARALFAAGERGAELAPALIEGLTSRDIWLFEDMEDRLVALGRQAVPALTASMRHLEAVALAEVCARIGRFAIPALLAGLENPKPASRRAALDGLRAVGADGGFLIPPIAARLKDEDRSVRAAAARALVPFAKTCSEAMVQQVLPELLAFFDRTTQWSDEEQAVTEAIVAIGRPALPAVRARLEEIEEPGPRKILRMIEGAE